MKTNSQLEQEIISLKAKINEQISENFLHNKTLAELREERDVLVKQIAAKKRSTSPKRVSSELFASQNELQAVEGYKTPGRFDRNAERKNRRQSVHDERRNLSIWERFTDTSVQTEAVSDICACSELTQKVKELQIEVRKRDCKISTMERLQKHNPLKVDLDEVKRALEKEKREHYQTKSNLESLSRNLLKLENKIEVLSKNQIVKVEKVDKSMQSASESLVEKVEVDQLERKLNELKRVCRQRQDRIVELESLSGKENISSNKSPQTDDSKVEEVETLRKKYDVARRLCNLRNDDLATIRAEVVELKEAILQYQQTLEEKCKEVRNLQYKYDEVKRVAIERKEKNDNLLKIVSEMKGDEK
jgi:hypothetical protein